LNHSKEPFAKVLEWFDSQVSMEEVYRFPLLRLIPFDVPPPFVIPAKAGIQRWANGKAAGKLWGNVIHRIVRIWIPAFAGMTESGIASIPQCKDDLPDLGAVYFILLQKAQKEKIYVPRQEIR
jgi:hypothetical protein